MDNTSSEASRTITRLHSLSADFGALGGLLSGERPVAGSSSLPKLTSWYATAQGQSAAALTLLLTSAEQAYAHTTVSGHHAMGSLGQLVKISSDITAHVMAAVAMAAEYHRVDGLPDPPTGRMTSRPSVRRHDLDDHLDRAVELIRPARAACHNAATFTETAALRAASRPPAPAEQELGRSTFDIPQPPSASASVTLTALQHRALHLIHTSTVKYSQWPRKRPVVDSGSPERITARSVDALEDKRLVARDFSTGLHAGQRLHLTSDGLQVLRRLGPAPEPGVPARPHHPGPAPVR
ncbi:hypothetical protein OG730_08640 [Streptomyces sp. NBC_01298]|uniref:hypothetical protein n=1 Tax=Streptomyces sp. NBC_01298 TaxID=2903817 RepID=UPI002E162A6F|nr:hypothetical protein OG730_08640 [Streptomyces sp. NBC_01298]